MALVDCNKTRKQQCSLIVKQKLIFVGWKLSLDELNNFQRIHLLNKSEISEQKDNYIMKLYEKPVIMFIHFVQCRTA
jgi:hypothetical protein